MADADTTYVEMAMALQHDVHTAADMMQANDSQFARRNYFRTLFAYFEGVMNAGSVWYFVG